MNSSTALLRRTASLAILVLAPVSVPVLRAQGAPDIVWSRHDPTNQVNSVAFSADGGLVASGGSDGLIRILQAASGNPVITLTNQDNAVIQIAFGAGDSVASWDSRFALRAWDTVAGTVLREQTVGGPGARAAFSPGGDLFAAARSDTLDVWRVSDGTLLRNFGPSQDSSPAFSLDSSRVAAGLHIAEEYQLLVWNMADATSVGSFTNLHTGMSLFNEVFSPDGGRIACLTGPIGPTEIWDLEKRSLWGLIPEQTEAPLQTAKLLVFTPDGKLAIMSDRDYRIRVWRLRQGQAASRLALYDVETTGINALAMSPGGDLFAYGRQDGTIVAARVPVVILEATNRAPEFILSWAGGSGTYQVQRRAALAGGAWENLGPATTARSFTNGTSAAAAFYRVQSLPN